MGIESILDISLQHYLFLSLMIFSIGLLVIMTKKNLIAILMGIEIMLNGINISAVSFSHFANNVNGHVITFFILTVAAAEVGVGLVLAVTIYNQFKSLSVSNFEKLKG